MNNDIYEVVLYFIGPTRAMALGTGSAYTSEYQAHQEAEIDDMNVYSVSIDLEPRDLVENWNPNE